MNPQTKTKRDLVDLKAGEECLLSVMDGHYLVKILEIGKEQVRVSFPGEDYPVAGMTVELQFHDEDGFNGYKSEVLEGPEPGRRSVVLRIPEKCERSSHRRTCRVDTDLTVQVKDHVHVRRYDAELVNLSAGGALLKTKAPFDFNTSIELMLSLPGDMMRTILGQVVHISMSTRTHPDSAHLLGVHFTGADADTAQAITRYVWDRLRETGPRS